MNIAETIYQHVKIMPTDKALEVLQFITIIETKNNVPKNEPVENDVLTFIKNLPILKNAVIWKSIRHFKR